jgi:hypothetical protein
MNYCPTEREKDGDEKKHGQKKEKKRSPDQKIRQIYLKIKKIKNKK